MEARQRCELGPSRSCVAVLGRPKLDWVAEEPLRSQEGYLDMPELQVAVVSGTLRTR